MNDVLMPLLKISLVIFMASNLLDMGLRLNPQDALRGLRNPRFVALTLIWGFVVGPALAYAITLVVPLETPYAIGLILIGMTPCAPFLPAMVHKAGGDLGSTAAFMLLTSAGMVTLMPFAVPVVVKGLTVDAWAIAKPLLMVVLLPLAIGMAILHASRGSAGRLQPFVKKTTVLATIALAVLSIVVYGKDLLGVKGSLAVAAQIVFFLVVTILPYWFGFGLRHEQKIVLSVGMATRNIGAALAPLFLASDMDQRAVVMVVLGLPIMVGFAFLASRWFGHPAATDDPGAASCVSH
jgi:BASS family bile acid:Na+ symporter